MCSRMELPVDVLHALDKINMHCEQNSCGILMPDEYQQPYSKISGS